MIFLVSLRKELMELVRTHRLLILLAILLAFGLMSPLMARYMPELLRLIPGGEAFADLVPEPTLIDSVLQFVKNTSQFGILMAFLLTMGVVVQEKDRGTAAIMLAKPISRQSFLMAKFFALFLVFLASVLLASLGAYYYTAILFETPALGAWMALTGLMVLEIVVYIAITLFFSTLVRSQAAAAGLGFGALLILSLLGSFPQIGKYLPGKLAAWGQSLFTGSPDPSWGAVWVSLGIIAVSLISAWAVFSRQEI